MEKKFEIVALGEALIDFTYAGLSPNRGKLFEQNPGGAPANMLTTAAHMGKRVALVSKVGADMHGQFLLDVLSKENVCVDAVICDEAYFTTLAFVGITENGEREFSFARKPGADIMLRADELDTKLLSETQIFHVGSLSLTDEPAREATFAAVKLAKDAGAIISYDPNYRASLWKSEQAAVAQMRKMVPFVDVMKVSEEEAELLTGEENYWKASKQLLTAGPSLVAITLGEKGAYIATESDEILVPAFPAEAVDTTGAGDSFWGAFLSRFLETGKMLQQLEKADMEVLGRFGNAAASLCVQSRGGIPAIPQRKAVEELLAQ